MNVVNAIYYLYIGSAFRMLVPTYLNYAIIIVVIAIAFLEVSLLKSISVKLLAKPFKKLVLTLTVFCTLILGCYLAYYIPQMMAFPEEQECYILELPVKDNWTALHAGESILVNYHCAFEAQKYAIDMVKSDEDGCFYQGEGKDLQDFYTMGQMILSPVDGEIVNVVDSLENEPVTLTPNNPHNPAGNHVVIKFDTDRYVFLAHLDRNTALVEPGQKVKAGDVLAKAGNSGNTSWPHLHIHIQDLPYIDNNNATAYPFRFKTMKRKRWLLWKNLNNDYLLRNDRFSH